MGATQEMFGSILNFQGFEILLSFFWQKMGNFDLEKLIFFSEKHTKVFAITQCLYKFAALKFFYQAGVAQLVEHNLAKVRVASSSLVSRSR